MTTDLYQRNEDREHQPALWAYWFGCRWPKLDRGGLDGILMVAAQALEKRTVEQKEEIKALRAENADLKARLEALERRVGGYALTRAE